VLPCGCDINIHPQCTADHDYEDQLTTLREQMEQREAGFKGWQTAAVEAMGNLQAQAERQEAGTSPCTCLCGSAGTRRYRQRSSRRPLTHRGTPPTLRRHDARRPMRQPVRPPLTHRGAEDMIQLVGMAVLTLIALGFYVYAVRNDDREGWWGG
jgi:hypothetical protein